MTSVYVETSFVSACVSNRKDPTSQYRNAVSREWWVTQAGRYERFASAEVIEELDHPGFSGRRDALRLLAAVPLLPVTESVQGLAQLLVREKVMPSPIAGDAIHVAVATIYRMDYLLSWNVRHLANPSKVIHLRAICLRVGLAPPQIVTPELLWEV